MKRPYHHGDLPAALLEAAEDILASEGLPALTLRAVARRVGVSHTAAAPHFGDLTGLLSELAAKGYRLLNDDLRGGPETSTKYAGPAAAAHAYVAFARDHTAMFSLMFRSERLDFKRPTLASAARESSLLLMRSTGAPSSDEHPSLKLRGRAVGNWSIVHGFAVLLIDGRLDAALAQFNGDVDGLLDAALAG